MEAILPKSLDKFKHPLYTIKAIAKEQSVDNLRRKLFYKFIHYLNSLCKMISLVAIANVGKIRLEDDFIKCGSIVARYVKEI